jgi:simple sugar transport system permease protein
VLYAALGELLAERSGVLNLGVEGTMLIGAVSGFAGATVLGSAAAGIGLALLSAMAFGAVFAFLVIFLRLNQIVTGLAFTILGAGISAVLGKAFIGVPPRATVPKLDLGDLSTLAFIGPVFLHHDVLVYGGLLLTALIAFYIRWTRAGLILRALGESPDVVDALGLPVMGLRFFYVMLGAGLAGLGGAYLSIVYTPSWIEAMTAGRGWIAISLVIFATWRPWWVLGGALLFGIVDALRFRLQIGGDPLIEVHFLNMLPYVATLVVLALVSRQAMRKRLGVPAALGLAYDRERR